MDHKEILKEAERISAVIAKHTSQLEALREKFEVFLTDQSIPLDERWEMYKTCPDEFSQEYGDVVGIGDDLLESCKDFSWVDQGYANRHQVIDFKHYICEWVDEMKDGKFRNWMDVFEEDPLLIEKLQEDVLAANTGTFVFDW